MQALAGNSPMFAVLFGGWELVLILAVLLILFGAKKLPDIARGLGEGVSEFRKSSGQVINELDQDAHDAGKGLGGIYGKPAAQALTPDNQTAELYDPAVFHKLEGVRLTTKREGFRTWSLLWRLIQRLLRLFAS
jgi:sec-independent protein translocase protein TatA